MRRFGIPPAPINAALEHVFAAERHLIGKVVLAAWPVPVRGGLGQTG